MTDNQTILEVVKLRKFFPIVAGMLRRQVAEVRAVDDVSFAVKRGTTTALVGESGCGKTTLSRCILRALDPTSGEVRISIDGAAAIDIAGVPRASLRPLRRHIQMIFQDPYASLNPRMMVGDIIAEPMLLNGISAEARKARVQELLEIVGLPGAARTRFPHAFSGGQRQRIGIARALALSPSLIVADEPVSALDVSVQAQIVNLLLDLQDRFGLSMLFVAHDLSVVRHVSDRVAVMYAGRIVETATTADLFRSPKHPYTEALLSAVPKLDPSRRGTVRAPAGEVADVTNLPPGCAYSPRCRYATEICRVERPELVPLANGTRASACHRAAELELTGVA